MRKIIRLSGIFAMVLLGLAVAPVQAEELIVSVPFSFVVHGRTLPAGKYLIEPLNQDPATLLMRGYGSRNTSAAIIPTAPAAGKDPAGDKPALMFTRHENQYRLSEIWDARTSGRAVWGS